MMKKSLMKRTLALVLALIMSLSLVACGSNGGTSSASGISLADIGEVSLINDDMAAYMADDLDRTSRYATGGSELSKPKPVSLSWTAKDATSFEVKVSEKEDLSDAWVYTATEAALDVYNLKVGTTYYWAVTATKADGSTATSDIGSFTTAADMPRAIYCDGITNMRDLGGWTTEDGKTVKQGMLYRSGRLNANKVETVFPEITAAGLETMKQLGIKTELDLREAENNEIGGLTESLIEGAKYVNIPMIGELNKTRSNNDAQMLQVFELLGDKNNYPLVFHCSIGTDRTGYLSYVINALLGVPAESLQRDYLLSNFGSIGGSRNIARIKGDYIDYINNYEGATLAEKAENFLLDLGVKQEQINTVREVMLG